MKINSINSVQVYGLNFGNKGSINLSKNGDSFAFSACDGADDERQFENCDKLNMGEVKKLQNRKWTLLPNYGVTFELAEVEKLDVNSKQIQGKLKKLKNNESLIIGRKDFPSQNLYISRRHLEFKKYKGNIYVRDISTNGTIMYADGLSKNYDFKYLREKYSKNPDFKEIIMEKCSFLRGCKYSNEATFVSGLRPIQAAISEEMEYGYKRKVQNQIHRRFDRMKYGNNNVKQEMFLNVVAHSYLIKELDDFFATGFYKDKNGQWQYVEDIENICAYYVTPANAANWANLLYPIRICSINDISESFYNAIAEITEKYKRESRNNIQLEEKYSETPWISVQNRPNEKKLYSLAVKAKNINKKLGQVVFSCCFNSKGFPIADVYEYNACKCIIEEYEEFLKQRNFFNMLF